MGAFKTEQLKLKKVVFFIRVSMQLFKTLKYFLYRVFLQSSPPLTREKTCAPNFSFHLFAMSINFEDFLKKKKIDIRSIVENISSKLLSVGYSFGGSYIFDSLKDMS